MKKILILLLFTLSNISFSQSKEGIELCLALQSNNIMSDIDAEDALERILDVIGASKNFALVPCDKISNAVATAYKGTRYILYDKKFMSLVNQNTNDWSNLFILAHEVGHHINGHSLDLLLYANDVVDAPTLERKRKQELEADEFAAFVLAKLGASIAQLNNVITLIANNSDDTFSTHPNRKKRLLSVKEGFNRGSEIKKTKVVLVNSKMKEYEKNKSYTRYGQWYKEVINDIFEGKKIKSITAGNIAGNQSNYSVIPNLIYEASENTKGKDEKISLDVSFSLLFNGFSARHTKKLKYIAIILDSKGDKIYEKEYSLDFPNSRDRMPQNSRKWLYEQMPKNLSYKPEISKEYIDKIPLFLDVSSLSNDYTIPKNELKLGNKLVIRFEGYSTGDENDAFSIFEELLYERYLKVKNSKSIYSDFNFSKIEFFDWFYDLNTDCRRNTSFSNSTYNSYTEDLKCVGLLSEEKDLFKEIRGEVIIKQITSYSRAFYYSELINLKEIAINEYKKTETQNIDLTDSYFEYSLSGSSKALSE